MPFSTLILMIAEKPDGLEPETLAGEIEFEHVAFGYDPPIPILTT